MTDTQWEPGLYVADWWGHYSTAQALVRAITEFGWAEPNSEDAPGPILTLALFDLSRMGPVPTEGSREWLTARLLEEQARAQAEFEGWDLEEDLSSVLSECLWEVEGWLTCHPRTPEGHYWGTHEAGGWGLWPVEVEEWAQ